MSRFKYICEYKSEGKYCSVYKDKITNAYYKMEDGVAKRVFSDDVKIAEKVIDCKKEKIGKKEIGILTFAAVFTSVVFVELSSILHGNVDTLDNKKIEKYETVSDYSLINGSRKAHLTEAMKQNNTIRDDLLVGYIDALADLNISEFDFVVIASNFKNYDFKNSEITASSLNDIFHLNDHGFVASELYSYVHKSKNEQKFSTISNIFAGDTDILERLFNRECLDDLIAEKIGTKVSIAEILENEDVKKYISKTEEKYKCFSGKLQNNIFNKFICLNIDDEYNSYLYNENGSLKNVTYDYYKFELMKQIYKHENLDYKNEFDRKLVYFYATANLKGVFFSDPVEEILYGSFLSYNENYLNETDLYTFLSNYEFDYEKLVSLSDLSSYSVALPLLQEVNLCLKEEVNAGNLSELRYLEFIKNVTTNLQINDYDDFKTFWEANKNNESIDGFKLDLKKGCNI